MPKTPKNPGKPRKPARKRARKRPATTKQRKFVEGVIAGKTPTTAAREAGYREATVEHPARDIANKPAVRELFLDVMRTTGITNELLGQRLFEGLSAEETKFFQKEGMVVESRNVIAWSERRAYVELALRLQGLLRDKVEVEAGPTLSEILAAGWPETEGTK
jgi:phage terminase small subunit